MKTENNLENKKRFFAIEQWKDIPFDGGLYQISNYGICRRWSKHNGCYTYKKPFYDRNGYLKYKLTCNYKSKQFMAHRLVAFAFVKGNHDLEINHIDGDKTNNYYKNLQWVTRSENIKHAIANGLKIGINKRDSKGRIAKGNQS